MVHGEREAEQTAFVSGLLQDVVGVQVERRQSSTSQEEDDRPQSTGGPALHEMHCSTNKSTGPGKRWSSLEEVQSETGCWRG